MTTGKVLTIIFSVILIAALAFAITWGIINWSKVEEGMKGNGLYTQEDINNAYQDGYDTALKDKDEYDILIDGYRDTITALTDNISQLNSQISTLTKSNSSLELQIMNLTMLKEELEAQVEDLSSDKTANEATIADLNSQILALNTEINSLSMLVQNHYSVVNSLNKTIADLQASIEYYEQYIATLETGETVVATFEFDGKVYSVQVVSKGSTVTIADPPSTEGVIFNGWTVDVCPVVLAEYPLYSNTKFVADVSYKYVVNFTVDGTIKSSQLVDKGKYAEVPSSPKKSGYTFKGWTLDGNKLIELDQYPITCDTTFIAKFAALYTVEFVYEGNTLVTRRIEENTTTNPYHVDDTPDKVFNGWMVNGVIVDVANYIITQDTTFVASITYYYEVTFMADGSIVDTQMIKSGGHATLPATPKKGGYFFDFWTLDQSHEINVESCLITSETTFYAKFYTYQWQAMTWKGVTSFNGTQVWTDGTNTYYSSGDSQYILDVKTNTWNPVTFSGCTSFYGGSTWTDGTDVYLSWNTNNQYVLNKLTRTWTKITWKGYTNIAANNVWTDGVNIYYSYPDKQYVLDVKTRTWSEMTWKGHIPSYGEYVWTDGVDYYYSNGTVGAQYVLDIATHTWYDVTWKNYDGFRGCHVWSVDGNIFYTSGGAAYQWVIDPNTHTLSPFVWNQPESYISIYIWTVGNNYYFSQSEKQFVLVKV